MAQQVLEVQQLTGQARNPVSGQVGGAPLTPYRVFNLLPDRAGGYAPYGRRHRLTNDSEETVSLPNISRLIGFDETGIASMYTESDLLQLFHGSTLYDQTVDPFTLDINGDHSPLVHMDTTGAYLSRDAYLVLDRDRRLMQPIEVNFGTSVEAGASSDVLTSHSAGGELDVAFGNGVFVSVGVGAVKRKTEAADTWTTIPEVSSGDQVVYGGGTFLIRQGNLAWRSTDDGVTWASASINSTYPDRGAFGIFHGGGSTFIAVGEAIWTSTDGGETWTATDSLSAGGFTWQLHGGGMARGYPTLLAPAYSSSPHEMMQHVFGDVEGGGESWTTIEAWSGSTGGTNQFKVRQLAAWLVGVGEAGAVVIAHTDGRISFGQRATRGFGGTTYTFSEGPVLSDTRVRKLVYNHVTDTLILVGSNTGETEPRVWHSNDGGVSWTRINIIENDLETIDATVVYGVAVNDSGDAMYVGSGDGGNWSLFTGVSLGLETGDYNVVMVAYFNTPAGRFVFALHRGEVVVDYAQGGRLTFLADTKETILANNPWMTQAIADDLRLDAYVQRVAEEIEGVVPENTIRYAFTEPFPSDEGTPSDVPVPVGRTLDQMPLGRQLIVGGMATTSVFEKSRTALHNGRMWGMANQDEALWGGGLIGRSSNRDGISLEIANQSNRFVLSYTEVGWANLMSDQSFIPIQPTQSTRFTGLLSTPMGLMVMFDNEIFMVTGDPAFGNVTVELYLDMGGCDAGRNESDPGPRPCKIGGVPFTIWSGKIWALQAGSASLVGGDQWLRSDPFTRIVPEPQTRSLLAMTLGGEVYRFIVDDQFWLTDPANRDFEPFTELLPNCACATGDNTRFVMSDGRVYTSRRDGEPDAPHISYKDVDFGVPERRSALYIVKATLEGQVMQQQYDRYAGETDMFGPFDPDTVPTLFYATAQGNNGSTYQTVDPQPGGILPIASDHLGRRVGTLSWRLPLGATRGYSTDLRLELRGMKMDDALRLPMRLIFSASGELR